MAETFSYELQKLQAREKRLAVLYERTSGLGSIRSVTPTFSKNKFHIELVDERPSSCGVQWLLRFSYRSLKEQRPAEEEVEVRSAIRLCCK